MGRVDWPSSPKSTKFNQKFNRLRNVLAIKHHVMHRNDPEGCAAGSGSETTVR